MFFILIPRFGLSGAAMATTLSYLVCSAATLVAYSNIAANGWLEGLFPNAGDVRLLVRVFQDRARRSSSGNATD